jgi:dihydroceramidase
MQLVDEPSMIYTTCLMFYATFSHKQTRTFRICLAIFLVSLSVFITGYYHYLGDPVFHQNMYALLTATVLFRSMYVMERDIRPKAKAREAARQQSGISEKEQQRRDDRDRKIIKTMWLMVACGLSIFLGGFGIWTLDNVYCSKLRKWRHEVGLPWGIFLEGHGWWHLMTGTGAYFYIVWGVWLRHCLNGRQDEFKLVWPSMFTSLPSVVKIDKSEKKQN